MNKFLQRFRSGKALAVIFGLVVLAVAVLCLNLGENPNEMVKIYCIQEVQFFSGENREEKGRITCQYNKFGDLLQIQGDIQNHDDISHYWSYDEDGTMLMYTDSYGNVTTFSYKNRTVTGTKNSGGGVYTATYDENGNMLSFISSYDGEYAPENTYDYWTYNGKGKPLSRKHYQGETLIQECEYTYDLRGNLRTALEKWRGELDYSTERTYDIAGRITYEKGYTSEGLMSLDGRAEPVLAEHTFRYDEGGRLKLEVIRYGDGRETARTWTYDEMDRLVTYTQGKMTLEWTYDENGNVATRTYSYQGMVNQVQEKVYTYTSFTMPRWRADRVIQILQKAFEMPVDWLWPMDQMDNGIQY